jgi:hypothetical protein
MNGNARSYRLIYFGAVACPLVLMLLLSMTPGISFIEDLGRHLVLGKIIMENGIVPATNLLTYTYPDFPFVNHHWLSELFIYLVHYAAGINGLIILKMLLSVLTLGLSLLVIRPDFRGQGRVILQISALWLCAILSAVIIGFRSHIRPELATYFFTALFLFLFEQERKLAEKGKSSLVPRLLVLASIFLWANLHIYFIFGIGMLGAFALERILEERNAVRLRREGLWFFSAILAASINPSGIKGFIYPFKIFSNYGLQITENFSPVEYYREIYNPMLLALPLMSVLLVAALVSRISTFCADREQWTGSLWRVPAKFADFPISLAALVGAWTMARSAPLLALCAIPPIMFAVRELHVQFSFSGRIAKMMGTGAILLLLAINSCIAWTVVAGSYSRVFSSPIAPTPFGLDDDGRYTELRKLKCASGLSGPVFNDYNIGSLVEYQLYPEKAYCDNRPEAFPETFWKNEYEPALKLGPQWREISKLRSINAIIVSTTGVKENFTRTLMGNPGWTLVHLDEFCGVWVRTGRINGKIIADCTFNEKRIAGYARKISEELLALQDLPWYRRQVATDSILLRLYGLICIGREELAWPYIFQMHLIYPDYDMLYELIKVSAPPDIMPEIERFFAGRAKWPLSSGQVTAWADHLIAKGRNDDAKKVLLRGRIFFPFSRSIKERLQAMESGQSIMK